MLLRALLLLLVTLGVGASSVTVMDKWNGGFKGEACIDFPSSVTATWSATLSFSIPLTNLETWAVTATKLGDGKQWKVTNNANMNAGSQLCFVFVARCNCDSPSPSATITLGGSTGPSPTTAKPSTGSSSGGSTAIDYAKALRLSILFYDAQRSGKLPANNPIPWRGDSALGDKGDNGEDLTGGWYDAGDHVKFNLPMASSTTVLLWGLLKWKDGYQAAGQLDMVYDMIKWPLDYFLKCWIPSKNSFYVQVGDGYVDHSWWGRPEDMTMARPAFKLTEGQGGSDVTGETAAAMAAGSIAFKDKNPTYSSKLLSAAKTLYEFGKRNQGLYSDSVPAAKDFYRSWGYKDELCEAAMWLHKATGESRYLNEAKTFHESYTAWGFSWENKNVACQLMLYEATKESQYKGQVQAFLRDFMPGGSVPYTPCGLAFRDKWGAARFAANAAFIALAAADAGIDSVTYRKWAQSQIHYILGSNGRCQSFQIGYGSKFPLRPHHRGASCPDRPAPCGWQELNYDGPSPQTLSGALVGGPDQNDNYTDKRDDYIHNEVTTDYNAGFQSALAGLMNLQRTNTLPAAEPPKCKC